MVKIYKLQISLILFLITVLTACFPPPTVAPAVTGNSDFSLANNSTVFKGVRTKDDNLKAITIPCQDNNTFRLYYSDSVNTLGLPDSLRIVSYSKRIKLAYKECCIEVTSSAGDTWLSTGNSKLKIAAGTGTINGSTAAQIWLQHFTSSPQPDSTTVNFNLIPE